VGPRASLDVKGKRKITCPAAIQTPDCPTHRLRYLCSKKERRRGGGLERKASPHAPYEGHITKLEKLHVWAVAKFYSVVFSYCTAEDYGKEMVILYDRYG